MIVLHALWENRITGVLHVFAESPRTIIETKTKIRKRRGRPPKTPAMQKPQQHPFALSHDALREITAKLLGTSIAENADTGKLTLSLPSSAKGPLHSPQLVSDEIGNDKPTGLQPWSIETLTFDPPTTLDLLISLPSTPPHGIVFGDALRFWCELAKFALELITKQCFIPSINNDRVDGSSIYTGSWEVWLSKENSERMHTLVKAMPPICHGAMLINEDNQQSPQDLVLYFLNQTIDGFIRKSLSTSKFKPSQRSRKTKSKKGSIPELWLNALSSDEPVINASKKELKTFSKKIYSWLDQVRLADPNAPFRTCFRLEPPTEENEIQQGNDWSLGYYLQANDDPSLLVPANRVWEVRSDTLTFLNRKFDNPQERFLCDLGKAAGLLPAIEESLRTAHPDGLILGTDQAYAFLRESAPLLEQSGFGVLLPKWWQKPTARIGVQLNLKSKQEQKEKSGLFGLDGIVAYDWQIAIGNKTLSQSEFEHLAKLKVPLVRVRDQWVELRPDEIEKAISFFKKQENTQEMTLKDALRTGLGFEMSQTGLPVLDLKGEGEVKDFLDKFRGNVKVQSIRTPTTFSGALRPYQKKGLAWLAFLKQFGLGACLADDMGLGKTIQLIALLLCERTNNKGKKGRKGKAKLKSKPKPTLIICPMSVLGNWCKELERFGPSLTVLAHHGGTRLTGRAFKKEVKHHDVVITTYALANRDEALISKIDWGNIVLDEAQNIKNQFAKQTQAIRRLKSQYKVALTGTPVENRLSELWSIMEFINPSYLGPTKEFHKGFAIPIEKYRNQDRKETLRGLVQPFVLRRLKTDKSIIKDLPEKNEMKVYCNLTSEQATLYEAVVKEMLDKIKSVDGMKRKGLIVATLMKLKQICNHPAQFLHDSSKLGERSGKLERLVEMLKEALAEGDKALIFTQFAEMGSMLRMHLQDQLGCEVQFLQGSTTKKQRDEMVRRFQEERHGPPIFLLSLKAGGLGLNLTAANRVFHFDRWWNPAVENQATDRAYRIGQKRNVLVHKFVCLGTLEERIDQMIEQKKELADSIIGTGETWITEMGTDQLKELFTLSRNAIGGA